MKRALAKPNGTPSQQAVSIPSLDWSAIRNLPIHKNPKLERSRLPSDDSSHSEPKSVTGPKRVVFMVLAGLFFVLGALGAILPVLPTTPFLLLTSYFLARTSPRLNRWLVTSRFFGPILKDWQQLGGVRPDVKAKAIMIVVLAVTLSLWLTDLSPGLCWLVVIVAVIGIGVILRLPAAQTDENAEEL